MSYRIALITLLLGLVAAPVSQAETMYVTDHILTALYDGPGRKFNELARLPTGTPVNVLEQQGAYAKVQVGNAFEGWVDVRMLSEREPAQAALLRLADQHDRAITEIRELREKAKPKPPPEPDFESFAMIAGSALLVGFILGALWLDGRYRRRHGGFRV